MYERFIIGGFYVTQEGMTAMGFIYVTDVVGHFQIHIPVLDTDGRTRRSVEQSKDISYLTQKGTSI